MDVLVYKVPVVLPGGNDTVTKNIVIGIYYPEKSNITNRYLLGTYKLFDFYNKLTPLQLSLYNNKPVIIANGGKTVNVTAAVTQIDNLLKNQDSEKSKKALDEQQLNKLYLFFERAVGSLERAKFVVNSIVEFLCTDFPMERVDNFPANDIDKDYLDIILSSLQMRDVARKTSNLFQEKCTDKLSFKLPTRAQLLSDAVDYSELTPKRSEICNPYKFYAMYTSRYKSPGSGVPSSMYPLVEGKSSNNALPIQDNEVEMYDTIVQWMQSNIADEYGASALEADEKNVVIDLTTSEYLNELLATLYSWHWSHNPNVPFYDPEEVDEQSDDNSADTSSKYSFKLMPGEEYKDHVLAIYPLQDFVKAASLQLGYKIYAEAIIKLCRWGDRKPTALYFEGFPRIFDLGTNTIKAYYGSISDYHQSIDSEGCNLIAKQLIFDSTSIVDRKAFSDRGYNYNSFPTCIGIVFAQVYTHKKDPTKRICLEKYYSMLDIVTQLILAKKGVTTAFKPKGFFIDDDGVIHAPDSITDFTSVSKIHDKYIAEQSSLLANPYFCNDVLQDLFIELKSFDSGDEISHFAIINEGIQTADLDSAFDDNSFSSIEELAEKSRDFIITNRNSAINLSVFKDLLPILIKVNKVCIANEETKNVSAILNAYRDAIAEYGYKNEIAFLANTKNHYDNYCDLCAVKREAILQKSNYFSDGNVSTDQQSALAAPEAAANKEEKEDAETIATGDNSEINKIADYLVAPIKNEEKASEMKIVQPMMQSHRSVIKSDDGDGNIFKIRHGDYLMGYCTITEKTVSDTKKPEYILHSADYFTKNPDDTRTVQDDAVRFSSVVKFMLLDLLAMEKSDAKIAIYFDSLDCLSYYIKAYSKLLKEKRIL